MPSLAEGSPGLPPVGCFQALASDHWRSLGVSMGYLISGPPPSFLLFSRVTPLSLSFSVSIITVAGLPHDAIGGRGEVCSPLRPFFSTGGGGLLSKTCCISWPGGRG